MKKIYLALALCLLLAGCAPSAAPGTSSESSSGESTQQETQAVTFTDDLGRQVTVENPQRVAVLIGSYADIWCLAGGKDTLVAAANDAWTSFDLGLGEDVANLGGVKETNLEVLLAAQPDLVLASSNTAAQVDLLPTLEQAGLNVAYFMVSNFDEYLHMLDICTQLTGDREAYERYGLDVEEKIEEVRKRVTGSRPTVLYIRATGSSCHLLQWHAWDRSLCH